MHTVTLALLKAAWRTGVLRAAAEVPRAAPRRVMGLDFPNAVGLAAGFDKNGAYVDPLAALGFGFLEVGTVTPRPQPGNPSPRLFRLPGAQALINRMGFNNAGTDALVVNLEHARFSGIVGVSIGKNADTPIERAAEDYCAALRKVYGSASYVALNVSSPGTRDLCTLQDHAHLPRLLDALKSEQSRLAAEQDRRVPLVVKVAPDLEAGELDALARTVLDYELDGIIATNSTLAREGLGGMRGAAEPGGLSGGPLRGRALEVLRQLTECLQGRVPIIASGGIMSAQDAAERIDAGASLIQLYTGLIYRGPRLIRECIAAIAG